MSSSGGWYTQDPEGMIAGKVTARNTKSFKLSFLQVGQIDVAVARATHKTQIVFLMRFVPKEQIYGDFDGQPFGHTLYGVGFIPALVADFNQKFVKAAGSYLFHIPVLENAHVHAVPGVPGDGLSTYYPIGGLPHRWPGEIESGSTMRHLVSVVPTLATPTAVSNSGVPGGIVGLVDLSLEPGGAAEAAAAQGNGFTIASAVHTVPVGNAQVVFKPTSTDVTAEYHAARIAGVAPFPVFGLTLDFWKGLGTWLSVYRLGLPFAKHLLPEVWPDSQVTLSAFPAYEERPLLIWVHGVKELP